MMNHFMRVFSPHPSHNVLRKKLSFPFLTCIRLGSTTKGNLPYAVEINPVQVAKVSGNKRLMKEAFTKAGVVTPEWWTLESILTDSGNPNYFCNLHGIEGNINTGNNNNCYHTQLPYPIIAKHVNGSRGTGNYKLNNKEELTRWMQGKTLENYIFERFYSYTREYRLHVTKDGCFYTCRKMVKRDTPENKKWQRHSDNCVWILDDNPLFDRPVNWAEIEVDCVKALQAIGADVLAFDVKVQSAKDGKGRVRERCDWIVIESCSAPSFAAITTEKYLEMLPKLVADKFVNP